MMPGSPEVGIVNVAGLTTGICDAGPGEVPVYVVPDVGVAESITISVFVEEAETLAPTRFPMHATAEPKSGTGARSGRRRSSSSKRLREDWAMAPFCQRRTGFGPRRR
jgi:hypothetical protein